MALFQFLLPSFVLLPFLGEWFVAWLAFEQAEASFDGVAGYGFEKNSFWRGLDNGFGAFLNMKFAPQPCGDNHLSLGGKPDGIHFFSRTHVYYSYIS